MGNRLRNTAHTATRYRLASAPLSAAASPNWDRAFSFVVTALAPFPEARAAVIAAIRNAQETAPHA